VNLRSARKSKSLTQEELAEKLGLSVRTVIRCEQANKLPQNRLSRERYCRLLGLRAR
jgi:DNA-binding XRE family transcriptional regulator